MYTFKILHALNFSEMTSPISIIGLTRWKDNTNQIQIWRKGDTVGVTIGGGPDWLAPFHHSTRSEVEKQEIRDSIIVLFFACC